MMKSRHCYTLSHGIKPFPVSLLLLSYLIILSISFVDAQTASDSTPSSTVVDDGGDYELEGKRVNPSMAIIIIVLVLGFFITGCISIYVQQCSEDSREAQVVGQPMRAVQRGVDQSVIDTYPTFLYSDVKELKIGKGALECAICITEFEEDETLRLLPVCDHVFHPECIDAWLSAHATCPVCRANLVADTGELSKAEVRDDDDDHSESTPSDHHHLVEVAVEAEPPKGRVPRSHSTGHSLVRVIRPSEDRERFTLRLTDEVRKQLMVARPMLKRTTSLVALPRVSSSRRGYRGGGEGSGSSRYGRFFGRWTTKYNGGDGDGSTGSKRFSRTAVTPMEALPRLPV